MSVFHRLICPLDQLPLQEQSGAFVCAKGHSFDLAKSGYLNLLPVQKKHSKDPGDSKEMVRARQDFLNSDAYLPIALNLIQQLDRLCFSSNMEKTTSILDAGCGEGYYLSYLQEHYQEKLVQSIGLDISKWAVQVASKRNKNLGWIVGSNANLPMPEARFQVVLSLFGFPVWSEFHRVLTDDGYVILVNAGENHLRELREILYPELKEYRASHYDDLVGFEVEKEETLRFSFHLDSNAMITALSSMTPHFYKASYNGKQRLSQMNSLTVTSDVRVTCLRKI
ncbi:methyltransferase domain-containing protein [Marinomonas agarivorans]|nr:methyltransferase domain-containing protein [Marinomonas agarivorans]